MGLRKAALEGFYNELGYELRTKGIAFRRLRPNGSVSIRTIRERFGKNYSVEQLNDGRIAIAAPQQG